MLVVIAEAFQNKVSDRGILGGIVKNLDHGKLTKMHFNKRTSDDDDMKHNSRQLPASKRIGVFHLFNQ